MNDPTEADKDHQRGKRSRLSENREQAPVAFVKSEEVVRRTRPPSSLHSPEPPLPTFDVQPTPSQYSFLAIAAVGAVVTGVFLFASLTGPSRMLSNDSLARLMEEYDPTASVAPERSGGVGMTVLTDPSRATVYVDFDSVGVTPLSPYVLESGSYFLTVSKPGYATFDTLVTLRTGDQPFFWFTLQPWDAEVLSEVSQMRLGDLPTETQSASAVRSSDLADEFVLPAGATRVESRRSEAGGGVEADPATVTPEAVGVLSVLVRPWGAIYIDGDLHHSNTDMVYTVQLAPGTHRVRVVHPTLGTVERTVQIRPEAPERVVFNLGQRSVQDAPSTVPTQTADGLVSSQASEPEGPPDEELLAEPASGDLVTYVRADEPPELIGGLEALQRLVRYPEKAYTFGVEGRVFLQFTVDEEGRVRNPVVTRGLGMGCDEEALRVVQQARFRPARLGGEPVSVQHALSIIFSQGQ